MKRVTLTQKERALLVCGLSNGNIIIVEATKGLAPQANPSSVTLNVLHEVKLVHDFGVNSLDARLCLENRDHLMIASGGDDQ